MAQVTPGYLWLYPYPHLGVPLPVTWRVFQSKQAFDHPKWSSIEWVMIKTIKSIITHSILNRFWWSGACLKAHGYENPYPYLYPCVPLPVTHAGFKTHAIHYPLVGVGIFLPPDFCFWNTITLAGATSWATRCVPLQDLLEVPWHSNPGELLVEIWNSHVKWDHSLTSLISASWQIWMAGVNHVMLKIPGGVVMARFGSEPRFEPEPMRTEPKFSSRFGLQPEPNLRSSSRFRQIAICLNLVRTGLNRTKSEQIQGKFHSKFEPNVTVSQLKTGIM
jgi:hypothetical protein